MKYQFSEKIALMQQTSFASRQIAVEFARALGFSCEAAVFPVTTWDEGIQVPTSMGEISDYMPETVKEINEIPEGYVASSDYPLPMPEWDRRKRKGLEQIFSKGPFLKDQNLDELPDMMDVHIVLPSDSSDVQFEAAVNVAFRLGMETTAFEGILLRQESETGNEIIFAGGEDFAVSYEEKVDGTKVYIAGDGQKLISGVTMFCETFPLQGAFDTWTDRLEEMAEGFAMQNLDGQLAYLEASKIAAGATAFVDATIDATLDNPREKIERHFPDTTFVSHKADKLVYEKEYDITWEVDDLKQLLESKVYPRIQSGNAVKMEIAVSEDKAVRSKMEKEIKECIIKKGADVQIDIICSYKQGYSWIDEKVNPALKALGDVERIEVAFKPFLPEGETEWKDEDGATPQYNNVKVDPEHWYDLPIRYLQELYPIEDTIVENVGVDKDAIDFVAYEGAKELTYQVKAFDKKGKVIYENQYLAANSERPYLDDFPQLGKVHPSTGYLRVWVDGQEIANERIQSDVEKIWDIYQSEVLPEARAYTEQVTEGKDLAAAQPFFSKLQLDVVASEPNELLNSREDLFSTLDGLHEDMYFAGTDYFKNFGIEKGGVITDAPGLILPVIKKGEGKPYFKASLYALKKEHPAIIKGDTEITADSKKWDVDIWLKKIEIKDGRRIATIHVGDVREELVVAYVKLLDEGLLEISDNLYGVDELVFETDTDAYTAKIVEPQEEEKTLNINDIDIMEHTLIGYEDCMDILKQLKKVAGLSVYRTTHSYMGRSLFAVELLPHLEGYISRVKRITNHPTELINTRHHANEVSGTNEAFMLLRKLLTDEKYKNLPDEMNLVLVPMENVDGTAIHYELQKDNPTWKFHVARFNAVGKEFYYEHFVDETIHREARGLKRLFMNKLPDFLIDNHGVPSHEWEQQFAGYTSPSFRGFWLPRSLIYGYFFHIDEERYKSNITLNKKMEDVVADAFLQDKKITDINLSWARQFEKYAHTWMPKLFPANYYKNMINYWIPSPYNPDHRYPSVKYPWILSVDYVSEVADETAQGDYLYECAYSHLLHDLAIIDMIVDCSYVYVKTWNYTSDEVKVSITRKRPVIAR